MEIDRDKLIEWCNNNGSSYGHDWIPYSVSVEKLDKAIQSGEFDSKSDERIYTPQNCSLIKKQVSLGEGEPEQKNGKCLGYGGNMDEPCEVCKNCAYQESYEPEYSKPAQDKKEDEK